MFRVVSLNRRGLAGFLLGLALLTLTVVAVAGAAPSASPKISARLTATAFPVSQAGAVKLTYKFSKPSKSFSYRLTLKQGSKWRLVRSVTSKKKGYFRGSKTTTVKKLFAGKPVRVGGYQLKLSAGTGSKLLGFRIYKIVPQVSAGYEHSCALLPSGSVKCWGANRDGQLGNGATGNRSTPVRVLGIANAAQVSAGGNHTCAVLSAGTVKCWGDGHTTPVAIGGISTATSISAGASQNCALLSDSSVKCWGYKGSGQLGDGTTTSRAAPVRVDGISNAVQVSAGDVHTCAVLSNGKIKCWGSGFDGQLGDGTTLALTPRTTPVPVQSISDAVQVSASGGGPANAWAPYGSFTCAVLVDGTASCWGFNLNGELGGVAIPDGRTGVPGRVSGITKAVAISTGGSFGCALLSGGGVRCWGVNVAGSLGDGVGQHVSGIEGLDISPTPVKVHGIASAIQIDSGSFHTCAVVYSGAIECWGANWDGQLGNGATGHSSVPVKVIGIS
jgi:alpha-tubulin suppressor-like RCC1 family protein